MGSRTGKSFPEEEWEWVPPTKGVVRELAETILICVLAIVFLREFIFQQSEIPSGSRP